MSKSFDGTPVLEDVTLTMEDGHIYGLVGVNGAGKTTLLNLISGIMRPESGTVTAEAGGQTVNVFDCSALKRELYYVTDDPYVLPQASIAQMSRLVGGFYPRFSRELLEKLCGILGLDMKKRIGSFSKGMKRKASLALGFAARPRYLLLDESFDGLDAGVRLTVCDLLLEFIADTGSTVILASHDLGDLGRICDTVALISGRRLVFSRDTEELKAQYRRVRAAFDGAFDRAAVQGIASGDMTETAGTVTFVTDRAPDDVRASLEACGRLVLFEDYGMTLEEIIGFEIKKEGGVGDVAGIFEDK